MSKQHSFISATVAELNRRKVLRSVGAYAFAVFILLELMDATFEPLHLPTWLPTLVVIIVILGFPLVFLLAWHLEIGQDGVRRTTRAGLMSRGQSAALFSVMLFATGGLAFGFYQYYSGVIANMAASQVAQSEAAVTSSADRSFTAPENSIAVLPFSDLSIDSNQGYFADGISEEILNLLARVDGLQVAARTSSFGFRDHSGDIREIGRLLNVRTILEGSVRTSGDRVRLTAQLINVEDGFHIWSQDFDREMTDLFEIQDEVAESIATALVESFHGLDEKPARRSDNLAAAQAYRTGRLHWWRRTPAELQRAIELFAEALELDANCAPAYAGLADSWLLLSLYGNVTRVKAIEKAQAMIDKALALDPHSSEAFAALGLARWQIGQLDAAESSFRQAIELNENYIPAQLWLAGVLGERGRYPEENRVLENAIAVDPLNELLAVNHAANLSIRGQWEVGRERLQELVSLRPDSTVLVRSLAGLEMANGNLVEGWRLADRAWRLQPKDPEDIAALAFAWLMLGEPREAEGLIQTGLERSERNGKLISAYWKILMIDRRYEEAEALVRETRASMGDSVPDALERNFDFQLGMIAMSRGDADQGYQLLSAAMDDDAAGAFNSENVMVATMASLASRQIGRNDEAEELLEDAERMVTRARINGVDDPGIYYTEAVLLTMRDQSEAALSKLTQAIDRGFREQWILQIDKRIDPLRSTTDFALLERKVQQEIERAKAEIKSLSVASLY